MQDKSNPPHRIGRRLKGAVLHPRRLEILRCLMREPNGTAGLELVKALGLSLRQVEYHLKVLHATGLIARVEDRRERDKAGRSYVVATGRR